ncbi:unnamed protein product [Pleuronectes platessa]|uniref:Uncharacterized protein n=1 Tax=Pleuronectes platessa TaxID=8262 RepID=A0A9N7US40_PLEPL|nr:unnamed protein product [Pleuronectes platessa]
MDSFRLNRIARKNPPLGTLSPMMLDRSCKQVLDLTTREIKKNIEKIILDDKKISPRIQRNRTIRPDQSYFGVDEEYVVKNLEDVLPLFFSTNSSDESRRYCESVCEFSRLIARETVKKINNRMALIFRDTSEGSCDLPDTLQTTISLIGDITNCLRTSSTTDSQEEDQDLHEHRGISHLRKSEESGKSDDGSSGDESSDDEHSDHGNDEDGDSEVECSDDGNGPPLVATTSINHCDEEDQDPQEDLDKESRVLSHNFQIQRRVWIPMMKILEMDLLRAVVKKTRTLKRTWRKNRGSSPIVFQIQRTVWILMMRVLMMNLQKTEVVMLGNVTLRRIHMKVCVKLLSSQGRPLKSSVLVSQERSQRQT